MLLLKQAWDSTMFKQLPENSCLKTAVFIRIIHGIIFHVI